MLKRIHVKGYKSLDDVEVRLPPLAVLFGPNAAGKSNFLDILQLLSKIGASRTLKEAFDSPYRGKPLESFTVGAEGIKGLVEQERLVFSIPENGVHPGRIRLIADLLKTRASLGQAQYIVTTHSPTMADLLPDESLFAVRRSGRRTRIDPFSAWGPLARRNNIDDALEDRQDELPVSERILRGDFDA